MLQISQENGSMENQLEFPIGETKLNKMETRQQRRIVP